MGVAEALNTPIIGNLDLQDIGSAGLDIYRTYQTNEGRHEAIDTAVEGFDQGIDVINQTSDDTREVLGDVYDTTMQATEPYTSAGTNALDHYMGLTGDPSSIANDPAYQWRKSQGEETVMNSLAAAGYSDPMGSSANPAWLTNYSQGLASQELDLALARDLPIIEVGQRAVNTGMMAGDSYGRNMSDINQYQGNNLVDLYTGRADALSTKSMLDVMAMNSYLSGANGLLNQAAGNPDFMDLLTMALGGGTTSDGESMWDIMAESFGFDAGDTGVIDSVLGLFQSGGGQGVASMFPGAASGVAGAGAASGAGAIGGSAGTTGMGAMFPGATATGATSGLSGGSSAGFGGTYAVGEGALASEAIGGSTGAATAGWGATAAAATPILAFAAIVALDQFFDDGANVGGTREKLQQSDDPLGFILNMSNSDLSGLSRSSAPGISGIDEKRGLFFSTMVSGMDEQGIAALKADPRAEDIVDDMMAFGSSSMYISPKAGGEFDSGGLSKLFPDIASDLKNLKSLYYTVNNAVYKMDQRSDSWDYNPGEAEDMVTSAQREIDRLMPKIYSHIYGEIATWG